MKEYTKDDLIKALKYVGLKKGDVVLVTTELFTLGKLKGVEDRDKYCSSILDAIFEVIGKKQGTVVVNAYTTYTARYGKPFDYRRSRPITGVFSEYVLFRKESIRSLHPINSVAAIGKMKREICLNVSMSNFGLDSPFDRMYKLGCQILRLGIDYADNAFTHYIETRYGLPYLYNKLLDIDVIVDNKKIKKPFSASVRHLELKVKYDLALIRKALLEKGCVYSANLGGGKIHRIAASEYCAALLELLKKDPYALLKSRPDFKKGHKPYDGITLGRDGVEQAANYLFHNPYGNERKE